MRNFDPVNKYPLLCSWSGGKDSYLACLRAKEAGHEPLVLLNNLNEQGDFSRSHGIPKSLLIQQAEDLDIPIEFNVTTWKDYEQTFVKKLESIRTTYSIEAAVYGDIDIESHRAWEEKVSHAVGLKPLLPIWQESRVELVKEMLDHGMKCLIVSCQSQYSSEILGKVIDASLLKKFDDLGIDVCGENGEYHSLVINGAIAFIGN